jgi:hypothetical protein
MSPTGRRTGLLPAGTRARLVEIALGLLLAAGLVVEVAAVVSRRPAWPVGAALVAITAAVCAAARAAATDAGPSGAAAVVLCGAAELVDWQTDRRGQPAPVACLALLVVVACAVRSLPARGLPAWPPARGPSPWAPSSGTRPTSSRTSRTPVRRLCSW